MAVYAVIMSSIDRQPGCRNLFQTVTFYTSWRPGITGLLSVYFIKESGFVVYLCPFIEALKVNPLHAGLAVFNGIHRQLVSSDLLCNLGAHK